MTQQEADREAYHWIGFARSLARRPPPLYDREDWEAEALLGLAIALRSLEPNGGPRATRAPYIRTIITRHLATAREAVNQAATRAGGPPRVEFAYARSMDASVVSEDGEPMDLHEIVPDPGAKDPLVILLERELLQDCREFAAQAPPGARRALGYMLQGLTVADVCRMTGEGANTVSRARERARSALKNYLAERGDG